MEIEIDEWTAFILIISIYREASRRIDGKEKKTNSQGKRNCLILVIMWIPQIQVNRLRTLRGRWRWLRFFLIDIAKTLIRVSVQPNNKTPTPEQTRALCRRFHNMLEDIGEPEQAEVRKDATLSNENRKATGEGCSGESTRIVPGGLETSHFFYI